MIATLPTSMAHKVTRNMIIITTPNDDVSDDDDDNKEQIKMT